MPVVRSGFDIVINHSLDTIFQQGNVEIDQQSYSKIEQPQVREQLCFINEMEGIFAFKLNCNCAIDY